MQATDMDSIAGAIGAAALFGSGDYADVKFVVEGEPVPAHRLVLCLRSPYFRRLFAARATSAGLREVTVSSASGAAFRALLRYLYTGALDASALTRPQLLELFGHAGLYEVLGLREACERALAAPAPLADADASRAGTVTRRGRRRLHRVGQGQGAPRLRRARVGRGAVHLADGACNAAPMPSRSLLPTVASRE